MSSSYVTLHLTLTYSAATSSAFDFVSWRPLRPPRRYPWIMARGRSTSSSPEAHRHRGKRDRRTSRRSRSPRRKSTGLPAETPPSTSSFETRYPIPKAWSPDDIYLDRQQEYKLTLPRRVVATAWSRDLHIDHQPIEDVRLIDVLSRKQENWTLRLVANGRLVQFEGFRNRQEAYLWSSLSRKIFKSSDVDIARIIGHLHPASLKDDWGEKRKGLGRLADRVFDHLRDQMPKNTTEALQDKVEQLIKENEKLKAATGRPSSPALSHSKPETPADRERLRVDKSKPLITPPAPPRSGPTLDSHFKPSTPEPEKATPPPAVPSDPLHDYIVGIPSSYTHSTTSTSTTIPSHSPTSPKTSTASTALSPSDSLYQPTPPTRPSSNRMAHLPRCSRQPTPCFSTSTSFAPTTTRVAILLPSPTTTTAPSTTGSRIHNTTHEHRSICHPVDCPPIGLSQGRPCHFTNRTTAQNMTPGTPTTTERAAALCWPQEPLDPLMCLFSTDHTLLT